ncbi:hypothetical protein R3X25_04115 [Lutibacter sp. TH_r2]|uniref:hypothetical protein n=1 Tax=Lutibacter sp. TH_r2 TaxID=3082083 RepID=UPI0029529DD2|nr:hypothetical protein [Lutibacter sp. TH_r2]MDV7186456.1 hypothetical protein [Lutibacter sp. TH_r2]
MKRVIVDFAKLNDAILDLLVTKFPDGYGVRDIIEFKNAQNETIQAVEVKTEDTIYLVKIGKKLVVAMEDYQDLDMEDDDEIETDFEDLNYNELVD